MKPREVLERKIIDAAVIVIGIVSVLFILAIMVAVVGLVLGVR